MPYRLRKSETISEGFRRVLFEQTASIVSGLSDRGGALDERIHDVRKRLKRLRAMLRLVELKIDQKELAVHEETMRSLAHKLAPARDATVVLATFEEMAVHFTGGAVERIRELLAEQVRHAKRKSLAPDKLVALAGELRAACEQLGRAKMDHDGWGAVAPGLFESYRSARRHRREAFANPSPVVLHDCRRLAKRLWEQLRLIRRALPKPIVKDLPRLEKFAMLLGRYHDFHLLQVTLREAAAHGLEVAKFPPLHRRIAGEMGRCLKRARKLGGIIFVLRSKAWMSCIHEGWKNWRGRH